MVQLRAPAWAYALPVGLVVVSVVLMALVVRANHGGLVAGEAQFAPDPRTRIPEVDTADDDAVEEPVGVGHVHGRVLDSSGLGQPASVTLVDLQGQQVGTTRTEPDGGYRLQPPETGEFVMICAPHRMGGAPRPRAVLVAVDGRPVSHDVVVDPDSAPV